jgi:hypothetical protein
LIAGEKCGRDRFVVDPSGWSPPSLLSLTPARETLRLFNEEARGSGDSSPSRSAASSTSLTTIMTAAICSTIHWIYCAPARLRFGPSAVPLFLCCICRVRLIRRTNPLPPPPPPAFRQLSDLNLLIRAGREKSSLYSYEYPSRILLNLLQRPTIWICRLCFD